MMTLEQERTVAFTQSESPALRAIRGVLWREWLAHRGRYHTFIAAAIISVWILPLVFDPTVVLVIAALFAGSLGGTIGGEEAEEGIEEFSFALPPTRGQRYLARLAFGGGIFLAVYLFTLVSIQLALPQKLWGLIVESGFTETFPRSDRILGLAALVPPASFGFAFVLGALAKSRRVASSASALGVLATLLAFLGGFLIDLLRSGIPNKAGLFALMTPVCLAILASVVGYPLYRRKEGVTRTDGPAAATSWAVWLMVVLGFLIALLAQFSRS